jgi:Na+-driven multidrug efflux pump
MLELCGIYLVRGRYLATLLYVPLFFIVMYAHKIWQFIFLVENTRGNVVTDQEAITYAREFVLSFFIGSLFCVLNDLQMRFLHSMGKSRVVLMS